MLTYASEYKGGETTISKKIRDFKKADFGIEYVLFRI